MKKFKHAIAALALVAMIGSAAHSSAEEYYVDPGYGYQDSVSASNMKPYLALGAIAAVAIIAVAVSTSSSGGHHHHHAH